MKIAVAGDSAGEGLAKVLADHLKGRFDVAEVSRTDAGPDAFYATLSDRGERRTRWHLRKGHPRMRYRDRRLHFGEQGTGHPGSAHPRHLLCGARCAVERRPDHHHGSRFIGPELAKAIVDAFLAQSFDEKGRSAANVVAINEVDASIER